MQGQVCGCVRHVREKRQNSPRKRNVGFAARYAGVASGEVRRHAWPTWRVLDWVVGAWAQVSATARALRALRNGGVRSK